MLKMGSSWVESYGQMHACNPTQAKVDLKREERSI